MAGPESKFEAAPLLDAGEEKRIAKIKKVFESTFLDRNKTAAVYEFREIFERYVGLSVAIIPAGTEAGSNESELHRLTGHKNPRIGSACLSRRNLVRLLKHRDQAREDLYRMLVRISGLPESLSIAGVLAGELADVLRDSTAKSELNRIFAETPQTDEQSAVSESGRDIWKPAVQQQFSKTHLPINLQAASARAIPSTED